MKKLYCKKSFTRKITALLTILICGMLILSACSELPVPPVSNTSETDGSIATEAEGSGSDMRWDTALPYSGKPNALVDTFSFTLPEDYDIISYTGNGAGDIYYLASRSFAFGVMADATELVHYDTKKASSETLCSFDGFHWVDELTACANALFWVFSDSEGKRIERYDLDTGLVSVIKSVIPELDTATHLQLIGDYLTWIECDDEEAAYSAYSLYAMDVNTNEIFVVSEQVYPYPAATRVYDFPFSRAVSTGDIATYMSGYENPEIVAYDLRERAAIATYPIGNTRSIACAANEKYMLWGEYDSDDVSDQAFTLYDYQKQIAYSVDTKSISDAMIDSIHLLNDSIIMSTSGFPNGTPGVYLADISSHTVLTVVEEDSSPLSYMIGKNGMVLMTINGRFQYENFQTGKIYYIHFYTSP